MEVNTFPYIFLAALFFDVNERVVLEVYIEGGSDDRFRVSHMISKIIVHG